MKYVETANKSNCLNIIGTRMDKTVHSIDRQYTGFNKELTDCIWFYDSCMPCESSLLSTIAAMRTILWKVNWFWISKYSKKQNSKGTVLKI